MPGLDGLGEGSSLHKAPPKILPPIRITIASLDATPAGKEPDRERPIEHPVEPSDDGIPTHPTLPETLPDSASASAPLVKKRSETIEEQIDGLISYEESGCLCCKRFFCHDERNVSTDSLILEKDRLNLSQLLNYEAIKVGKNFQQEDDAREANRRNCLKILSEAAISVNCLKLPFAQFNTLSMRIKALVITIQVLWISFLVLWFSVNKFELYQCDPRPTMHPWQNYTYAKYNCLVKSGYFHNRTSSRAEFELIKADDASGWSSSSFSAFETWKEKTKFNGAAEYMEIFTTLCDRVISVAAMYMFHSGTYTEALYPPMLDETFLEGAGTHKLAVRRPRKYIQQVAVSFLALSQIGALLFGLAADQCVEASRMGTLADCVLSTLFSWQYYTSAFTIIGFLMGGLFVQLHNSTVISNCLQADWAENILRVDVSRSAKGAVDHLLSRVSSEARTVLTPKLSRPSLVVEERTNTRMKSKKNISEVSSETEMTVDGDGGVRQSGVDQGKIDEPMSNANGVSVSSANGEEEDDRGSDDGKSADKSIADHGHGNHGIMRSKTWERSVETDAWGALYKKVISCLHVWSWRWSPCVLSILVYLVANMVKDFTLLTRDFVQHGNVSFNNKLLRFIAELVLLIVFLAPIVYIDVFYRRLRVLVALHRLEWTENFERLHQGHAAFTLFDYPIRVEFALSGFKVLFLTVFVLIVGLIATEEGSSLTATTRTVV